MCVCDSHTFIQKPNWLIELNWVQKNWKTEKTENWRKKNKNFCCLFERNENENLFTNWIWWWWWIRELWTTNKQHPFFLKLKKNICFFHIPNGQEFFSVLVWLIFCFLPKVIIIIINNKNHIQKRAKFFFHIIFFPKKYFRDVTCGCGFYAFALSLAHWHFTPFFFALYSHTHTQYLSFWLKNNSEKKNFCFQL